MKIGFIGCGNMGGALARAVAKQAGNTLLLSDTAYEKAEALALEIGAVALDEDARCGVYECDVIFLGVKPGGASGALWDIRNNRQTPTPPIIVSMAAGVVIGDIEKAGPKGAEVIRIMPNTPVSVGEGMVLYALGSKVKEGTEALFLSLMSNAGKLIRLEENQIDKATAISGCGPAYAFMFLEAMIDGGLAIGLPYELSKTLAAQTLLGSAKTAMATELHPAALRSAVCSPGGSTIEGVMKLEEGGLRSSVEDAIRAAYDKTTKLGK